MTISSISRGGAGLTTGLMASAAVAVIAAVGTLATPGALGQASPDKLAYGKHLAQECVACHRADGRGGQIPPIVGLEPDYFITTMKFYKTGARTNPVMGSVAEALGDEQLEALAAYLATQKPPPKQAPAARKK